MIELDNVTKKYGSDVTAVDQLSFTIKEGETFGLIGTSGCGKTTTLKMMNRLVEPTFGSILVDGKPIELQEPEQLRHRMGYVIQDVGLFPHYTVEENVAITPKLLNWDTSRINQRSEELLEFVGLNSEQLASRKPEALSGGQQQRVGLARALAADPPIILMDEPFGAVDPITKEQIQKKFKELLQGLNKTIVLVTHDVFEAYDFCDRVCLMDQGQAQQIGTLKELLFQPENEFVRSFFDEHRFQLQMMCVTVKDIVETIAGFDDGLSVDNSKNTSNNSTSTDKSRTISLDDSFFSVFKDSHSRDETCRIAKASGEIVGRLKYSDILEGFQRARRQLKEGNCA